MLPEHTGKSTTMQFNIPNSFAQSITQDVLQQTTCHFLLQMITLHNYITNITLQNASGLIQHIWTIQQQFNTVQQSYSYCQSKIRSSNTTNGRETTKIPRNKC